MEVIFIPNYICSDDDVLSISLCHKLVHLSVDCRSATRSFVKRIPDFKNLKCLDIYLSVESFPPEVVAQFYRHSKIAQLTDLYLFYDGKFDDDLMMAISQCRVLKILHLESSVYERSDVTTDGLLLISRHCHLLQKMALKFGIKYSFYEDTFEHEFCPEELLPHLKFVHTEFYWGQSFTRKFLKHNKSIVSWLQPSYLMVKTGTPRQDILNAFGYRSFANICFNDIFEF